MVYSVDFFWNKASHKQVGLPCSPPEHVSEVCAEPRQMTQAVISESTYCLWVLVRSKMPDSV